MIRETTGGDQLLTLAAPALGAGLDSLEALGEALFHDVNLSANRTQACTTCHRPDFGFVDPRETDVGRAVSLGDDGTSLGDRNTPTASSAMFSPPFEKLDEGICRGGQFLDGREPDPAGQAGGPPLNPLEMGMPHKVGVVARLEENPACVDAFVTLFGRDVWDDAETAYRAMTEAIAAFESTDLFAPFDSRYDRFLRGEVALTKEEELGRLLFFSQQFTNCNLCHQLRGAPVAADETFSNYKYHSICVPERQINPETGAPFAPPEVPGTPSTEELETGPALDDQRVDALVDVLKSLTDARYEVLLEE